MKRARATSPASAAPSGAPGGAPDVDLPFAPDVRSDVCLILEGTWPYVRGGVSSWVAQLLASLPELTFSVIYLGARADEHVAPAYPVPPNVLHVERHFLLEAGSGDAPTTRARARRDDAARFERNSALHTRLRGTDGALDASVGDAFAELSAGDAPITADALERHELSWATITEKYGEAPPGLDFNHFFWTVRSMHAPLFTLSRIASAPPPARLYHSVSTGYAGWLGSMLKSRTGCPYLISEHGIYTKERELDLAQVDWIPDDVDPFQVGLDDGMSYLRRVWIRFFRSLGRMSYASADRVFTLYEGNRLRQLADGAPAERLSIIPNGVDVARFAAARRPSPASASNSAPVPVPVPVPAPAPALAPALASASAPAPAPASALRSVPSLGDGSPTPGAPLAPEAGVDLVVPPVLALIGRVVPIKDVKTFVRAMRIIRARVPDAEGWLVGPEDEDPAYTEECRRLVSSLGLDDVVRFLGFGRPEAIFPRIGLNVLTSVSEGQPLTVLEGFAAGVPALTTDVGGCRELIEGRDEADRALGAAGAVVPIASPAAFAEAAVGLLGDADAWARASAAAIARVESRYDERDMIRRYREVYTETLARGDSPRRQAS